MFLYDLVLGTTFVCFIENKNSFNLKMLIAASILSVGFKITAVIGVFFIIAFVLIKYSNEIKRSFQFTSRCAFVFVVILSITLATFHFRLFYFDNPFFPVLTSIFNLDRPDYITFSQDVFLYQRALFIPDILGGVGNVLGPFMLLAGILILANSLRLRKFDSFKFLGLAIFLCTVFFAQSRADYLFLPIFLFFLKFQPSTLENIILRNLSIGQSLFTGMMLSFSIYQTIIVLVDFNRYMPQLAKGFELAEHARNQEKPVLIYNIRQPRLFMDYDYIDTDSFSFCITSSTFSECLAENQIRTLYIQPSDLKVLQGNTELFARTLFLFQMHIEISSIIAIL